MKHYIFLTSSIARVGGAQLYIARKSNFLIENGWNVTVIHYVNGDLMIDYNKRISSELIYELGCSPTLFNSKQLDNILQKIFIPDTAEEIVVESHTINLAYWGEIIISRYRGKHLIYLLSEKIPFVDEATYKYLEFKYINNSLFGITPISLKQIFPSANDNLAFLNAIGCTSNNVEDLPNEVMDSYKKSDWNILSIGRLDKDYIAPTFESLAEYARKHENKKISIILVGGSYRKWNYNRAIKILKKYKNISISNVGYVWPIPMSCFYNSDLTIASSGSAIIAESTGAPVIVIDGKDLKPIGIYKRTTNSFVFRTPQEQPISLSSLLDDILIYKKYNKKNKPYINKPLDYTSHMNAVLNCVSESYPLNMLFISKESLLKRLIISIIKAKRYTRLNHLIFRIMNNIKKIIAKAK